MLNKRILSLLLAIVLVIGLMPTSVFATETEGTTAPAGSIPEILSEAAALLSEGEEAGEESGEPCNICNVADCGVEHKYCEKCEKYDCGKAHVYCEVCQTEDCGQTHEQCDLCDQYDCNGEHEYCTECDKYNCGIDHNATCDLCGKVGCEGHAIPCMICGQTDCGKNHVYCDTCEKHDCGIDHTVTEPSEGTTAPSEPGETTVPAEGEETEPAGPQVGDKIWIKKGSYVYKDAAGNQRHQLLGNYEVKIKAVITDDSGAVVAYEFEFTDLELGEFILLMGGYKYVQANDTTTEEPPAETTNPAEENACDCEYPPESGNLAQHADSCARKTYIKTLFEGKTAEEIYAEWETYDEATQTDILNMLEVYDAEKFEELNSLVNNVEDASGLDIVYVEYEDSTSSGVDVNVTAPEGAFPEGTTISVTDTEVSLARMRVSFDGEIMGVVAVDISFEGEQPSKQVTVTMDIPASKIPSGANKVVVVHMGDVGMEVVGTSYLDTSDAGETISFATTGFSSYAAVFVNSKYNAQKMQSALAGDSRYSISEFSVDLFDYDPVTINNALNGVTSDGNGFHFTGYNITGMGSNNGINNSASTHAKQGILQSTLTNGLPVINHLNGSNAGINTGKVLFSDSEYTSAKTVYDDIPFEFVYDNQTGYYEYKSSANHAQLNDDGTKIELYADTVSTENSYVVTLDLSTANGISDMKSTTASSSSFKGTVYDGTGNQRLDPYVHFTVDDVAASGVGQIYVKAKVPAGVGANKFQLFFVTDKSTGYSEDKSFGNGSYSKEIPYTANGEWIEFVIDTSENANWKDTITGVRVDLFDSNKGSDLSLDKEYSIEIKQISFIKKNYDAYATRGGFYPFSEIQDTYPGNNTKFDLSAWKTLMQSDNVATARASRSIFNPAPSSESLRYAELAYGLVMEFDFYIPVNKQGQDGTPLQYYFNGDDDLWVFVDDQIVLDIGGGHGAITGSVNFTTGAWNVENAVTVTGYNSGADASYAAKSGTISSDLYSPGRHTMKVFYLERGGSVSNCYMKFNLPRTPQGNVTVSKSISEQNNANTSVLEREEFEFQISVQNNGSGEDYQEVTPFANADFILVNADASTSDAKTDANGKFILKHGQEAVFVINENYKVTVSETENNNIAGYDWVSTTVNGTPGSELTQITEENIEKNFDFVNTYDEQEVTITYIPVNPQNCPENGKGTVELTGSPATATSAVTGVSETIGSRVGVPVGSSATETNTVKFVGWYSDPECENLVTEEFEFTPTKPANSDLWVGATYYAKFEFKFGNLTIHKNGISALDHHVESGKNKQETQSTIYTISGTALSGETVNMEVMIVGNGSTTIKNLPVGTYTVTENTDWSWRYEPKTNGHEVTIVGGETTETTFENEREEIYWLSGDSYCENWWNASGNVTRKDS